MDILANTKPALPAGIGLQEALRYSFNPTPDEVAEWNAKREAANEIRRQAIASLKAAGKW